MVIKLILGITASVILIQFSLVNGLVMPIDRDDVLETFDVIVIGTVTNVERPDNEPPSFQIKIEDTTKPDSFNSDTITAIGCDPNSGVMGVPCPNYEIGERGLFLALKSGNEYELSFRSQIAEANCTGEQFLSNYEDSRHSFYWTQNEQSDTFFTKEPVDIHFTVRNQDLKEKNYSIRLVAGTSGSNFVDVVNGTIKECVGNVEVTTSFVPTKMGTYSFSAYHGTGGQSSSGTAIIDYGSTPREQFKAGVHGQETWCKAGLFLILKNDDTKPRADNQPACVTAETLDALVERNWGFIPPESNASGYLGKR